MIRREEPGEINETSYKFVYNIVENIFSLITDYRDTPSFRVRDRNGLTHPSPQYIEGYLIGKGNPYLLQSSLTRVSSSLKGTSSDFSNTPNEMFIPSTISLSSHYMYVSMVTRFTRSLGPVLSTTVTPRS